MISRIVFSILFLVGAVGRADTCFYCGRIEKLETEMAKVKPEPLNERTGLKQSGFVDDGIDIVDDVLKASGKNLAQKDLERIVTLLGKLTAYDAPNIIGQALLEPFKPHMARISSEVRRQDAAGLITKEASDRLLQGFASADHVVKHGNAGDDDSEDSAKGSQDQRKDSSPANSKKSAPRKSGG